MRSFALGFTKGRCYQMFDFLKKNKPQDLHIIPEPQQELKLKLSVRQRALNTFSNIEVLDDIKEMMLRALESPERAHTLLVGPPACSKSLFMLEIEKGMQFGPIDLTVHLRKGQSLFDMKNYQEAIGCFDRILRENTTNLEALANKGHCNGKLGRYQEAIACYNRVLEMTETGQAKIEKHTEFDELELGKTMAKFIKKYIEDTIGVQTESNITSIRKNTPHETIRILETRLRNFIHTELSKLDNDNWWRSKVPQDIRKNVEERKERNDKKFSPGEETYKLHPLDFVDFPDYLKIITKRDNWTTCFKKIFRDEQIIAAELKELEPIRNSIAHGRDITKKQEDKLFMITEEILDSISVTGYPS
jgi:tetratricopeptide (TPR) repeat protein